jgi:hypothetical protein
LAIGHSVYVLNHKCVRAHYSQDAVKFAVEKVYGFVRVSATALTVALTGVAAHKEFSVWEIFELPDITLGNVRPLQINTVCFAGYIPYIVRPNDLESRPFQCEIASAASAEE